MLATALVAAGCVAPLEQSTPPQVLDPTETAAPEPGGVEEFYTQELTWQPCGRFECTTVRAPLDWSDPEAGEVELALKRSLATGAAERQGSLLVNPGGPGSSGVEFLDYAVTAVMGERVVEAFDVVGFDPRGVGESTAVACGDDAAVDEAITGVVVVESQEDLDVARADLRAFGEACRAATGPLLGLVDTVSAARDMDLMRAVLGDVRLHYAGFSYGTFLGATYAHLYPHRVGRLLLDAAVDPTVSLTELVEGQAAGFEAALRAYVEDCQAGAGCPLPGDVDEGAEEIAALVARIRDRPLRAGEGQQLNSTMAFYGIVVTLYDERTWGVLTTALEEALRQNTGALLLELANLYLSRNPDGTYSNNSMVAFNAVNCLDYPAQEMTYDELEALSARVEEVAPTFGREFVMGPGCEAWPVRSRAERVPTTADGAPPIVVIGTTGDPATPYEWSVSLAEQLSSGVLVTYEGEGHTAYGRSNDCIADAVDAYLVDGTVPEEGLVC